MNTSKSKKKVGFKNMSEQAPFHYTNLSGVFINSPEAVPTTVTDNKKPVRETSNEKKKESYGSANNLSGFEKKLKYQLGMFAREIRGEYETPEEFAQRVRQEAYENSAPASPSTPSSPYYAISSAKAPLLPSPAPPPPPPPPVETNATPPPTRARGIGQMICNAFGRCFRKKKIGGTRRKQRKTMTIRKAKTRKH
jgi:hypothetical protein